MFFERVIKVLYKIGISKSSKKHMTDKDVIIYLQANNWLRIYKNSNGKRTVYRLTAEGKRLYKTCLPNIS